MVEFNKTFEPLQAFYKGNAQLPVRGRASGLRTQIHGQLVELFQEQA